MTENSLCGQLYAIVHTVLVSKTPKNDPKSTCFWTCVGQNDTIYSNSWCKMSPKSELNYMQLINPKTPKSDTENGPKYSFNDEF